jgi:hypothetical protein
MDISRKEAQQAFDTDEDATNASRSLLASWAVGVFVVGVIWTVTFAASQFLPENPLWSLGETFLVGIAFAIYWGQRRMTAIRVAPQSRLAFQYTRLAMFYGILYLFFLLWQITLLRTAMASALLWITVIMFAAIITGVWLREPVLIGCGVAVTALTTLGYWLLPQYFWLWIAVFAGLPLIAVSIYLWRRRER